jgi:hypothetical protein
MENRELIERLKKLLKTMDAREREIAKVLKGDIDIFREQEKIIEEIIYDVLGLNEQQRKKIGDCLWFYLLD